MQAWRDLATLALVGAEQQPGDLVIPKTGSDALDGFLAKAKASVPDDKKPEQILRLAASLTLSRRAGYLPPKTKLQIEPSQSETLKRCSTEAGQDFKQILQSMGATILDEWLLTAAERNLRAPAELLPDLMSFAKRNVASRARIAAVLGERGKWLASQNEDWEPLFSFETDLERVWEVGPIDERRMALHKMRLQDPAAARAKLEAAWKDEAAAERAQFVGVLRTGLSIADEPFLLQATEDRSKEVKPVALLLLKCIPDSKWVRGVTAWADKSVVLKKGILLGQKLEVDVTDECSEALGKLGVIDPKTYINRGIELTKELYLQEMLGSVPPQHWPQTWGLSVEAILKLGTKPLLTGWAKATARFHDKSWLDGWLTQAGRDPSLLPYFELIQADSEPFVLDRGHEPKIVAIFKATQGKDLEHLVELAPLLKALQRPWGMEVTRLAVLRLNAALRTLPENDYRPRHALNQVFARAAPQVNWECPEALTIWPKQDETSHLHREMVDSFCHVVEFRKRMHRNLAV